MTFMLVTMHFQVSGLGKFVFREVCKVKRERNTHFCAFKISITKQVRGQRRHALPTYGN